MNLLKRLLAASGAAGLLVGLGATPALAAQFSASIAASCINSGAQQTINVESAIDALVHIEVTIGGSTANGGTANGTGVIPANGSFSDQWTVGSVTTATTAGVQIWVLTSEGVAHGSGTFTIQPANSPCPTPSPVSIFIGFIDTTQVGGEVKKSCDAGVSGNAVFTATIHIIAGNSSTTITLPAGSELTLACNGDSELLPALPVGSTITLHESTPPSGAAVAADTTITMEQVEGVNVTTIHNTKAAAVATPTPTARVLPQTGQRVSTPSVPWLAIVLLGGVAVAGAGLVLRRRS